MDDLSEKLAGILNDPQSIERIRGMAQSLFGGEKKDEPQRAEASFPDISEISGIMGMLSRLKAGGEDDRTRLLLALKPHLSEERQRRVDTAVKILRVIDLLPALKESGLLEKLL
ncbi:MAG: hypothetical protein E7562_01280 [Ruminococcaceae bacterium]|nr:hypothetical protein [Oscillospiraceae bacterium]